MTIPTAIDIVRSIERRYVADRIKRDDLTFTIQHETGLPLHQAFYYAAKISIRKDAGHPDDEVLT